MTYGDGFCATFDAAIFVLRRLPARSAGRLGGCVLAAMSLEVVRAAAGMVLGE